ncbi:MULTISPECIES: fatty acid desaturase family protein [Rhizobium]|uniref:Dihydrorhizobitoxine desaturase n=2 Tax=Rhizobium TaxID=379 RepID=A0A179C0G2_RHILE|nr:fatty acid desaturase family protein [Rhizobium leguminosarum]ANP89934.1 dihydrorhizobitoxine desaturase [Rhizobium leguminosarum]ANP90544.1 dihydrorhizobitoxine desaturase [Rhizobium leguminosarum]API57427.1 dihydrorhizobitoxine desaturase [Rhizobium leguminosarum]OAP97634.1 dihydrorhizobitoxine desaturase [Rhizobium leguminosarum]
MVSDQTWQLTNARYESFRFSAEVKKALAELRPDNITGALYIAKDYAVIVLFALLCVKLSWWFYPLALLFIGAHQRGLTTIAHDAAHRTLARNGTLNYALGILFAAYPLFQKHWAYRVSHVYLHHPHLGDPDKDPDLKFFLESGVYKVRHPVRYITDIILLPLFGAATIGYLRYLFTHRFKVTGVEKSKLDSKALFIDKVGFYAFWTTILVGSYWLNLLDDVALFWIVPYLTTFQALGWFIEIAEHSPMCETEKTNLFLTRNRKGNCIERLLLGVNLDEYHLEHHLSPGIPFWLLKKAQKIRMRDPNYAEVAATWGGLFVRGPQGQRSVMSQLMERNERLYWQHKYGTDAAKIPLSVGLA